MFKSGGVIRLHDRVRPHLKCVFLPKRMDNHPIPILQCIQIDKGAGQAIRQIDMARDDAVAVPGGEGTAFQPSSLPAQPGHIPLAIPQRHADNGDIDI